MKFKHLIEINQTYFKHFKDAISYSIESFKCSFYFTCHAFYPDMYKTKGSTKLNELHAKIQQKYNTIKIETEEKDVIFSKIIKV